MSDDPTANMKFMGLCLAQWGVILREAIKAGGVILVSTKVLTSAESDALMQGLTLLAGGGMITAPIVIQILKNSILSRIKTVSELSNVKGVVTDSKTAHIDLADAPKVVSSSKDIKGE